MSDNFDKKAMQTCPTLGSQTATVCLPVTISPYAVTGPAMVHCCGEPVVGPYCNHCHGKVNGTCEFTISQKIRVDIPVEFGATVNMGGTYVECGCASAEELKDCIDRDDDCNCEE